MLFSRYIVFTGEETQDLGSHNELGLDGGLFEKNAINL